MSNQSRKWLITQNSTELCYKELFEEAKNMKALIYMIGGNEIGENGTFHTHIFIVFKNPKRFETIKNAFPKAHIDSCRGTNQDNKDYILKQGKHTDKSETRVPDSIMEFGDMPVDEQGKRNDLEVLYKAIKDGLTNYEIIEEYPFYMFNIDKIERVRQTLKEEEYKNHFRDLEVTYIWGTSGSGKTRHVMERYGYSNVYRVTDYKNPWDSYKGQDVIIFEEFRSSLKLSEMLNYLDGYPLELPCRYSNKIACYTRVYIITNIDITEQYETLQWEQPETYKALLRRIHDVMIFKSDEEIDIKLLNKSKRAEDWGDISFIKQ